MSKTESNLLGAMLLLFCSAIFQGIIADGVSKKVLRQARWNFQHADANLLHIGYVNEDTIALKKHADEGDVRAQQEFGLNSLYGLNNVAFDELVAVEYLTRAKNRNRATYYILGEHFWSIKEYQKAMDFFEEGICALDPGACQTLGDLYYSGFSSSDRKNHYLVPQDRKLAFMHYFIGALHGSQKAALAVGEYYERGYHDEFGIDYPAALRWYEYARCCCDMESESSYGADAPAILAIARLKQRLADLSEDSEEARKLRQEAYQLFESTALFDPYAKLVIAVYHLKGWSAPVSNPYFGFELLLSLVECGTKGVLHVIAECYKEGACVERDVEKSLIFQNLADKMG